MELTLANLTDLYLAAVGKIEFYWNFYTVAFIAIVGWVISAKRTFRPTMKIGIVVAYLAFALMNIRGLLNSYRFAEALRLDVVQRASPEQLPQTHAVLNELTFSRAPELTVLIHVVMALVIGFVIWKQEAAEQ